MNHFDYVDGELHCEEVSIHSIAEAVGTPFYVYSTATLTRHFNVFTDALSDVSHCICYSVKACSNIAVLKLLSNLGSGFDIVSGGELYRLQAAGISTDKVVFSGVGKTRQEMEMGLDAGIMSFNVESMNELELLNSVALERNETAPVSLRINPDIDPKTHPYISTGLYQNKFGIPWEQAVSAYAKAATLPGINVVGLDCHIGSQLTKLKPLLETVDRMLELVDALRAEGHNIEHLDLGGGLGIKYDDEKPPHPTEMAEAVIEKTRDHGLTLVFEPGRVIVGNAGIMVTQVLFNKAAVGKDFVIVDAAMNDAMRPTLYGAFHDIKPVSQNDLGPKRMVDVVGPICESGDFLARDRALASVAEGELLAMMSAGAYGFSMASNYNSRPRSPEVLVDGDTFHVVRNRESLEDLVSRESVPAHLKTD